jgi:hypothetical protein
MIILVNILGAGGMTKILSRNTQWSGQRFHLVPIPSPLWGGENLHGMGWDEITNKYLSLIFFFFYMISF